MSKAEECVRPVMSAMMRGEPVTLNQFYRERLAAYFTYKMMIMDWVDHDPSIPAAAAHAFYQNLTIPTNTYIFVANCFEGRWRAAHLSSAVHLREADTEGDDKDLNTKSIAIGFANLFVLGVFSSTMDIELDMHPEEAIRLWPSINEEVAQWPPYYPTTSAQANFAAHIFEDLRRRMEEGENGEGQAKETAR